MTKELVGSRISFTAATSLKGRKDIIDWMDERRINTGSELEFTEVPGLADDITYCVARLGSKLSEIGINDPASILPKPGQDVRVVRVQSEFGISGVTFFPSTEFTIHIPSQIEFPSTEFKRVFFHESSHFIKRVVLGKSKRFNGVVTFGGGFVTSKGGAYEEGNAELFSLFCLEDDAELDTCYPKEVCFLTSILKKFAREKGLDPLEVYKRFARANITRDFGFQGELVDVFGTQAVRGFNNFWFDEPYKPEISESERMLFGDEFCDLYTAYQEGQLIAFPGMDGGFRKASGQNPLKTAQKEQLKKL